MVDFIEVGFLYFPCGFIWITYIVFVMNYSYTRNLYQMIKLNLWEQGKNCSNKDMNLVSSAIRKEDTQKKRAKAFKSASAQFLFVRSSESSKNKKSE